MKAHTVENKKIVLSIGMIVKNEEKVLERCLKSLQSLMKAIPSELIIADTGSTDSTVEIAKKYTDNVFHFEWINDFAAARNSTLEKAKGKWYFFLDADEYLDNDVSEVIKFFSIPELRSKYNTLAIKVRNYISLDRTEYLDSDLSRFFNIENKDNDLIRFVGTIHEGIPIKKPYCCFSTILHHTGYMFNSSQQNLKKKIRNLELMRKEYNDHPKDLRILSHIIDGTGFTTEEAEKEKYIQEALEIARSDRKNPYSNSIYMQAVSYYKLVNPGLALELCEEYRKGNENIDKYITTISIVLDKALILSSLAQYENSYETFMHYFKLYNDYIDDKFDKFDLTIHPVYGIRETEYIQHHCTAAVILCKLRRFDEAFDLFNKFDINELDGSDFKNVLGIIREISQNSGRYDVMAYYHEKVMLNSNDDNKKSLALFMMESTYYFIVGEEKRKQFAEDVLNTGIKTGYSKLMKLTLSQNKTNFVNDLQSFIESVENWEDGYNEAIYLAIQHGLDISKAVDKMKTSDFRTKLETLAVKHDDFASYVLNYGVPEKFLQTIKRFYWITSLYEKASYRSFELNDQKRYALYLKFVELLGQYVFNIYNPELLEDESDTEVLPVLHRFGYYMYHANQKLNEGNAVEYIREMKKALEACESMREIVEFMLEQFKKIMGMSKNT